MRLGLATLLLAAVAVGGCATVEYTGRGSLLPKKEQLLLRRASAGGGYLRLWRLTPGFPSLGLVKWDSGRAAGSQHGRETFLESIREELGRVNQTGRQGEEVRVAVTLLDYSRRGLFRRPTLSYELVGRTKAGTLLWAAFDEIQPSEAFRSSLADDDEILLARSITAKFKAAFGL